MSTYTYRVIVERIEISDAGDFARSTTLFKASSPSAGRLNGFAPAEVASALQDVIAAEMAPAAEPAPASRSEDAPEPVGATATFDQAKPVRKRRTKAEIEADRLAAEGAAVAQVDEAADTVVEQMAAPLAAVPDLPPAAPELPQEAPAAPYNPFLPK